MARLLALGLAALLLAGCSTPDAEPSAQPPGPDPDRPSPSTSAVSWEPVDGPTDLTVTTNGTGWVLTYDEERGRATLAGPQGEVADPVRGRVSDALLSDEHAVVVHQARDEDSPATAVLTDLSTQVTTTLDADTAGAPTTNGGTWALDGGRAAYATSGGGGDYCLAEAALATGVSRVVWCAADRQGFSTARLADEGDALLTFDDAQPSCRTLVTVSTTGTTPFDGVTACQGFDGLITDAGTVWSEVPDEQRVEAATFFARVDGTTTDLGPGTSGTLTACGGSAWFVRDPQGDTGSAELVRWDGAEASVAFTSRPGRSFLSAPRCAGDQLTVSSFSAGGDEQVSASVG